MDDFLEFLRSGGLGGVRVGTARAAVQAALGEADDINAIKPLMWKYGTTEITFRDDAVVMIAVSIEADPDELRRLLDRAGLSYERYDDLTYDAQEALVIQTSGVIVTLDLERPNARAFATLRTRRR